MAQEPDETGKHVRFPMSAHFPAGLVLLQDECLSTVPDTPPDTVHGNTIRSGFRTISTAYLNILLRTHPSTLPHTGDRFQSRHPCIDKRGCGCVHLFFRRVQPYLFPYDTLSVSGQHIYKYNCRTGIQQSMTPPTPASLSQHPPVQHLLRSLQMRCILRCRRFR